MPESVHLTTLKSCRPSALNVVKNLMVVNVVMGIVEDVVEDTAIEEAVDGLLEALAAFISMPSVEL
jgi:hypothetical protein